MKNIGGILLNFSLFIGCFLTCSTSNTPKVQVHSGEIAGGFEYTYNGRTIYSFLGIPYASPPIQNNRFKEPQPVQPWLGVWNATVPGSACLGIDFGSILSDTKFIGQEDCLFLNVYTPKMISDRSFLYGTSKAAQHITAKNTAPVYFYEFGYSGNYSYTAFFDPKSYNRGSSSTHGDETSYVLKVDGFTVYDNDEDRKMIKTMVNIWATFIKTGVPDTENSEIWLPVSKNPADLFRFTKITQQQTFEAREQSNHGNYEFWSSLPLSEYFEFNVPDDIKTEL